MVRGVIRSVVTISILVCTSFPADEAVARYVPDAKASKRGIEEPNRVLVLDGSSVHNVGELQMHLLNWGEWGSRPGTGEPYSFSPSAQWPAGSGVEYLFTAGVWIGAIRNGVPSVSTATYDRELRPSQDKRDKVYRAKAADEGGNRLPSIYADDDGDGRLDEDYLDGRDNDGDGLIDEDFAAISNLMYACRYNDYQAVSKEIYPEHNPLDIAIRQESYQWDENRFDDFIGVEYTITNAGSDILEDVYIGMFVDGDIGRRDVSNYWEDDMTARRGLPALCTDLGPVQGGDIAYMFDADGDNGDAPGLFGVMFLGHNVVDSDGAPWRIGTSYAHFSGRQTFQLGGDPTTDFERYEILSQRVIEDDGDAPRDYRMLVAVGPFPALMPDSTMVVQMAFVMGGGEHELFANSASARLAFMGAWFDGDEDVNTGIEGRETQIWGPKGKVWEDECRKNTVEEKGCDQERLDEPGGRFSSERRHIGEGEFIWSNVDCNQECTFKWLCNYQERDSLKFRSGAGGRESQTHWLIGTAPPHPNLRVDGHAQDGVVIYWDNFSETIPDGKSQRFDFEGYQIWRADNWTRPLGTSLLTGPPTQLWGALLQVDRVNGFGEETGLEPLHYEPLTHILSSSRRRDLINTVREYIDAFPGKEPFCPPGVSRSTCDTLIAIARFELGLEGGRRYYRYVDKLVHRGMPYFYSVVAFDHGINRGIKEAGVSGDAAGNFIYVEPSTSAQYASVYDEKRIYVVPNPVTRESMEPWKLGPTNNDPSGLKVEFRNLPPSRGTIRVYTISGDLVEEIPFDASGGVGSVSWDLISRSGQEVASGIYLYSIDFEDSRFTRVVKKFTVIQ